MIARRRMRRRSPTVRLIGPRKPAAAGSLLGRGLDFDFAAVAELGESAGTAGLLGRLLFPLALLLALDAQRRDRPRQQAPERDRLAAVLADVDLVGVQPAICLLILPSRNFSRSWSRISVENSSSSIDSSIESRPMFRSWFIEYESALSAFFVQPAQLLGEHGANLGFFLLIQHR